MDNIQLQIDLTNIVLALIAVVALLAAWRQLNTMQVDSKTQIKIAQEQELATRASVLLSLDARFGTQAMLDARNEMSALIGRVYKNAEAKWGSHGVAEVWRRSVDLYPVELETMRNATPAEAYGRLMVALSFFETVGYVTSCEYIPLRDVIKLFGPTIEDAGIAFKAHITKLNDSYPNKPLYNNFLWLIEESRKNPKGV